MKVDLSVIKLALAAVGVTMVGVACSNMGANSAPPAPGTDSAPESSAAAYDGLSEAHRMASLPQQRVNVSQLYDETCAKCHGDRGQGGGAGTSSLLTREKFDQKFDKPYFDAIKDGVPDAGMESYGQTLSNEAIWGLVVHIRELQARHLRQTEGGPKAQNGVFKGKRASYKIETVVDEKQGLVTPWGIDWLPDGRMLVTNRPGFMVIVEKNGTVGPRIEGIPDSREIGQGGLMEVTVHPKYKDNGWIYLGYTDPAPAGARGGMTKIVRGKLEFGSGTPKWTNQETIFACDPSTYNSSGVHFGNRIVFDGKGHIFFAIGERGNGTLAQDLSKPNGKIYRVKEDGKIPDDNPFVNREGAIKAIWSYGHRNPQGLVFDLKGNLWDTEHAPRGGDEVNLIVKGANYGWPIISFGINYNDSPYATPWPKADQPFKMPAYRWLPSVGACGLDLAKGPAFPEWKGDLIAGGLSGANVDRFRMENGKLVEQEELLYGMGRVRDVSTHPDGTIYVALNQPDKIVRIAPAKSQ